MSKLTEIFDKKNILFIQKLHYSFTFPFFFLFFFLLVLTGCAVVIMHIKSRSARVKWFSELFAITFVEQFKEIICFDHEIRVQNSKNWWMSNERGECFEEEFELFVSFDEDTFWLLLLSGSFAFMNEALWWTNWQNRATNTANVKPPK